MNSCRFLGKSEPFKESLEEFQEKIPAQTWSKLEYNKDEITEKNDGIIEGIT